MGECRAICGSINNYTRVALVGSTVTAVVLIILGQTLFVGQTAGMAMTYIPASIVGIGFLAVILNSVKKIQAKYTEEQQHWEGYPYRSSREIAKAVIHRQRQLVGELSAEEALNQARRQEMRADFRQFKDSLEMSLTRWSNQTYQNWSNAQDPQTGKEATALIRQRVQDEIDILENAQGPIRHWGEMIEDRRAWMDHAQQNIILPDQVIRNALLDQSRPESLREDWLAYIIRCAKNARIENEGENDPFLGALADICVAITQETRTQEWVNGRVGADLLQMIIYVVTRVKYVSIHCLRGEVVLDKVAEHKAMVISNFRKLSGLYMSKLNAERERDQARAHYQQASIYTWALAELPRQDPR